MSQLPARTLARLAELQFPLLFMPTLLIGCGTFGFGFEYRAADITLGLLAGLVLLYAARRVLAPLSGPVAQRLVFGLATAASLALYRPLHFDYWDERSVPQAVALALLGLLSLAVSLLAQRANSNASADSPLPLALALLLVGAVWTAAYEYPLVAFGLLGSLYALLTCVGLPPGDAELPSTPTPADPLARWSGYGLFLAALSLGWTLWDFQQDPTWSLHVALFFAVAALSSLLASTLGARATAAGLTLGALGVLSTLLVPNLVLSALHPVAPGLALGLHINVERQRSSSDGRPRLTGSALPIALGIALGLPFALNLPIAAARAIFLLPLLRLFVGTRGAARAANASGATGSPASPASLPTEPRSSAAPAAAPGASVPGSDRAPRGQP